MTLPMTGILEDDQARNAENTRPTGSPLENVPPIHRSSTRRTVPGTESSIRNGDPFETAAAKAFSLREESRIRVTGRTGFIDNAIPATSAAITSPSSSGSVARFFYCTKASRKDREEGLDGFEKKPVQWSNGTANPGSFQSPGTDRNLRNHHPTVKPTALMRWLCRLVTPAGGLILDPFMGSGSTGKAAVLEGFRFVGIDVEEEYVRIAEVRIKHACGID